MILKMEASCSSSGSAANDRTEGVRIATFHQWKYSHYFVVVEERGKNMQTCCTLCSDSTKPLSCARNTTNYEIDHSIVRQVANS